MTRVIVDDGLRAKLHDLTETLVLCDEAGHIFGHFVPSVDFSEWEPVSPDASEEELGRRSGANEPRYSTADVLAHLDQLSGRKSR